MPLIKQTIGGVWIKYERNGQLIWATPRSRCPIRREARRTGGGPPLDGLSSLQDKVVEIIGETPIEGIAGGTDTCSAAGESICDDILDFSLATCTQSSQSSYSSIESGK